MSNLVITTKCNKRCPYCFARDSRKQKSLGDMTKETFLEALAYLKRSGINQVRLLGGEPTLHKDLIWMLEKSLSEGFNLMIFSNGLMPEPVRDFFSDIASERIRILLNTIHPLEKNTAGMQKQKELMQILGRKVMPGVNIYSRRQDITYLIKYVKNYKLHPEIRVGIAHPLLSAQNLFLKPKFYSAVGHKIVELFHEAKKDDIHIGLDCGFVPCMFPMESHEILKSLFEKAGACCNPNLDLLPDGKIIACYPLNNLNQLPLTQRTTAPKLISTFKKDRAIYEKIGIFPYCSTCELFHVICNGGCLAHKINRLKTRTKNLIVNEISCPT